VTGSQTITLPTPVPVGPGNFFVGIQQTNTTNVGLSFDAETPIRSGAFYISTTLNAGPWSDFSPGNNFKLNIGLNLTGCLTDGDCNDNNVCTNDSCNTGTGLCVATPNTAPCNDNNACTSNDTCGGGVCAGTPSVVCNDNDPCTADACDPATGQCLYTPTTGGSCSDGNACTGPDLCGCISTGTLTEYFDEVATPSLPSGWTTTVTPGTANAWVTSSTASDTPPNSAFTDDPATVTDKSLFSPAFLCGGGQVSFMNSYNTESTFDGMVLEIKIGAGAFQDILAAGGSFASGGYNGTISANFSNPLGGRQAWTGNSSGFVPTIVNLPASATGKVVVLRWRLGSDTSASATGAFIDSVSLPTCTSGCLPGGPANCNDNNPCTDDSCNPGTGCVYANNANACDDGNPCTANDTCGGGACTGTAVGAPPEVSGVTFALNKQTLSWASALTATNYDAVRGALAALPVGPGGGDEVCFDNLPGTSMVDGAVPVTGAGFWYIVRGESACGNGSYGQASGGSPRITTTCP
jgi:hypothetical protein